MNAMTNAEWEQKELEIAQKDRREIENLPLSDRKENYNELVKDMQNIPETVAERAGWLLNGTYGHGQMILARRALEPSLETSDKHSLAITGLFMYIAIYEWRVGFNYAKKAWHAVDDECRDRLAELIQAEIDWHNENERQIAEYEALKQAEEVVK